jgi:HTH-type transcriptional regulator / antitoxin HipB
MKNAATEIRGKHGTISLDALKEKTLGKTGTKTRDKFERDLTFEVIGELMREIRKKRELSQEELADILGIDRTIISKVENNTRGQKLSTLFKYAEALGCQITIKITDKDKTKKGNSRIKNEIELLEK